MEKKYFIPIVTSRDGNKITKVCVEDVYKMINRIQDAMNSTYNNTVDVLESVHRDDIPGTDENGNPVVMEGELIVGTGTSQPCLTDDFDEEIGSNIAFMKAKLNANIKKHNLLCKVFNKWFKALETFDKEIFNVDFQILSDLHNLRIYNSEYLEGIEDKLGISNLKMSDYENEEEEA